MHCQWVRRHLDALLNAEVEAEMEGMLLRHLAICPCCGRQAGLARMLLRMIVCACSEPVGPELLARLVEPVRTGDPPITP